MNEVHHSYGSRYGTETVPKYKIATKVRMLIHVPRFIISPDV